MKKVFVYMDNTGNHKRLFTTYQLCTIAILAAIASILFMLEIPVVLFYKLDFSSLPVLLGAFAMGPLAGTFILFLKAAVGLLHTTSQGVGELADFLMGFAMMFPASMIYKQKKNRTGAIVGMLVGTVIATVVAAFVNLYIMIPFYSNVFHMPIEQIIGMGQALLPFVDSDVKFVLAITAPFNLVKWVIISVLTALIYKPFSPILHGKKGKA